MTNFKDQYNYLLNAVLEQGVTEHNNRTGRQIKVLRGGHFIVLDLRDGTFPLPGGRKIWIKSAAAETAWYLQGTQQADFIMQYAPMWDKFLDDEEKKLVMACYGYRWRRHFGRDQILEAIIALQRDPSDRQIVVVAWDPGNDAMGSKAKKNVPCPLFFSLNSLPIPGTNFRELNMSFFMRSSDVFVGLPYDVLGHALLLQAFTTEMNERTESGGISWRPGTLQITLAHAHLYDKHYMMAAEVLHNTDRVVVEPRMPSAWSISKIIRDPHGYVETVIQIEKNELLDNLPILRPEVIE